MNVMAKEAVDAAPEPGWTLLDRHSADFLRLQRVLKAKRNFQLVLCQFNSPLYRDKVISQVNAILTSPAIWTLPAKADEEQFEGGLAAQGVGHDCLHLIGLDQWLARSPDGVLRLLNYHRERIAELASLPLLLWISPAQVALFARQAPDLWAWRAAVLDFTMPVEPALEKSIAVPLFLGAAPADDTRRRIAAITGHLSGRARPTDADASLLLEAADASRRLGDSSGSDGHAKRALEIYRATNNQRGIALAQARIVDALEDRGDLDQALRILREALLPVFERLGDSKGQANTLRRIADILQIRGDLDDVLRIRREQVLPIYERLGDLGGQAITLRQIAEVLAIRGEAGEAVSIFREAVSIFERLGDEHSRAVALANIAQVLLSSGRLDEAARVLQDDVLPVFLRLGDEHSRAATLGMLADILVGRGDLDEALRISQDDILKVFEQLGDVRGCALTLGRIAGIHQVRGELVEALRIRRDEELPAYERIGDAHGLLGCRASIASLLLARAGAGRSGADERAAAEALLCLALADARRVGIPTAIDGIESIVAKYGLRCAEI